MNDNEQTRAEKPGGTLDTRPRNNSPEKYLGPPPPRHPPMRVPSLRLQEQHFETITLTRWVTRSVTVTGMLLRRNGTERKRSVCFTHRKILFHETF